MPSAFLTCKEQERLACFPDDIQPWDLITYFTMTEYDCSLIDTYQGESNRLGAALQLCAVRYLGFCPANLHTASSDMTAFLARQLKVDPSVLQDYGKRRMTRQTWPTHPFHQCGIKPTGCTRNSVYAVCTNSNSHNCCVREGCGVGRRRACGRYSTRDSWRLIGRRAAWGEAKRVG